ncbi:hypothetical protein RFI_30911 [Reticulomyxa filosa]|uniref:Uncharacterized protein n=1 Tax=Reticulomyxa filosa TaxID=46433 RepID=X6LYR0_RETFI|nr:hypothetical protein RFI_30911 [Reticulomyxa filosa]|eukprot:ETO06481.1 hypothetical protein RFI_30911 [Reticulomyxa filosa]
MYAEDKIQLILQNWIRRLHIRFGWINEFDKLVINYVYAVFMFDKFCSSSKLINTFTVHTSFVYIIDYITFGDCQLICSGSYDTTVCVCDVDNNKQIQSFNGHSRASYCVNFHHIIIKIIIKIISNYKYLMKTQNVFMELNFHHLMAVDICFLDLVAILFVYEMLKHQNHYMFSIDMKMVFVVLIFHHYKATAIIAMTIIILNELYVIEGYKEDCGISCLKFIALKKNSKYDWNLCYCSAEGSIHIYA